MDAGNTLASAQSTGRHGEIGVYGLSTTGVYSNADLAANLGGVQFYTDLVSDPTGYTFRISRYIRSDWNEQSNPSFYESEVADVVWANVRSDTWEGSFNINGANTFPIRTRLIARSNGNVKGSYEFLNASGTMSIGKINNGRISKLTTSVSGTDGGSSLTATPVSGVTTTFDWTEGSLTGKGAWESSAEGMLQGAWGFGNGRANGGSWNMIRN